MIGAWDLARHLLSRIKPEQGDSITHLKLQKLLYYCQGWHLAAFGAPIFREEVEAWELGPVVRSVYGRVKGFGDAAIPPSMIDFENLPALDHDAEWLVQQVWERYARFSGSELVTMTHREEAWRKNHVAGRPDSIIPRSDLEDWFRHVLERELREADFAPATDEDVAMVNLLVSRIEANGELHRSG